MYLGSLILEKTCEIKFWPSGKMVFILIRYEPISNLVDDVWHNYARRNKSEFHSLSLENPKADRYKLFKKHSSYILHKTYKKYVLFFVLIKFVLNENISFI